jgi:Flp pilus assembly protein TadD
VYIQTGQYDQALAQLDTSKNLARRAPGVLVHFGVIALARGHAGAAAGEFERALALRRSSWPLGYLGCALARLGRRAGAEKVIAELQAMSGTVSPDYEIATICAALGDRDRSLAALERAYADRSPQLLWVNVDRMLDSLRGDPRFAGLLKRMKLQQTSSASRS